MINLTDGWVQHSVIPGAWHLEYVDPVAGFNISIITGPTGSRLMGVITPGKPTTYEAWLPGLSKPTGYLTLDQIRGIIMYLRDQKFHPESRKSMSLKHGDDDMCTD